MATHENVAASTQNQALNALVFLYGRVLLKPLGLLDDIARPQRPARLPVVLTPDEVKRVLAVVPEKMALPLRLLYGTGTRVMEGARFVTVVGSICHGGRTTGIDWDLRG